MSKTPIKFGTDGWRAVIADDYTYENVTRVARAIAHYVHKHEDPKRGVLVAYDTRFGSNLFAKLTADELVKSGLKVGLADAITPTPALSYAVKHRQTAGGVMITSSHNPWNWNGVKFKATFGGSATPAIMKKIESYLDQEAIAQPGGELYMTDLKTPYIEAVCQFADVDKIAKSKFKICVDVMYGAGRGILKGVFEKAGVNFVEIRSEHNPLFPGINPEPIMPHLQALCDAVTANHCDAGFATDGDADRIGAVDETGKYVTSHMCFAVMLNWLLKHKPEWTGAVTRAYNTTLMLDRICAKHGRELVEHGIGFKYVSDVVLSGKEVLIGGEESGGIGIPRFLPERDGVLNSLLLANAMADEGKTLGQLVEDLQQEYGRHCYNRVDLRIAEEAKQAALKRCAAGPKKIGRFEVERIGDLDGYKIFLKTDSDPKDAQAWVLVRASGTEPLMRIYSEAASDELVAEILQATVAFAEGH